MSKPSEIELREKLIHFSSRPECYDCKGWTMISESYRDNGPKSCQAIAQQYQSLQNDSILGKTSGPYLGMWGVSVPALVQKDADGKTIGDVTTYKDDNGKDTLYFCTGVKYGYQESFCTRVRDS